MSRSARCHSKKRHAKKVLENIFKPTYQNNNSSVVTAEKSDLCVVSSSFTFNSLQNSALDSVDDYDTHNKNVANNTPVSNNSLNCRLRHWALNNNVNHKQLDSLLKILKPLHPYLPMSSKTLLNTERNVQVSELKTLHGTDGYYYYFGIKYMLQNIFKHTLVFEEADIKLLFNIDGIPLQKSTSMQFWPILGKIVEAKNFVFKPFVVGLFYGNSKPQSVNEYVKCFIDELNELLNTGFQTLNGKKYKIVLKGFVCDAPARAFLKCIKGHTGFYGCERCIVKGELINHRMVYLSNTDLKRTHDSFISQSNKGHHTGVTPFTQINGFDLVQGFFLDYMHMSCLGVMRRLLSLWLKGNSKLSATQRRILSDRLVAISPFMPFEFSRKARDLKDVDRFKATEFRFILLYAGPIILKGLLSIEKYRHFLKLHVAMRMLCMSSCDTKELVYNLMHQFTSEIPNLYGNEEMVYNIHSIHHMAYDVLQQNYDINEYSCFDFENYLGQLIRLVRGSKNPLQQVVRRILELNNNNSELFKKVNILGITRSNGDITKITLKFQCINPKNYIDSYVILKSNRIMKINRIEEVGGEILLIGNAFQKVQPFFENPCSSQKVSFFKVSKITDFLFRCSVNDVITKAMVVPWENESFLCVGLLKNL